MANRLYIVPVIGTGAGDDPRRPKYFDGLTYAAIANGREPWMVVGADLSVANHNAVVANADVQTLPVVLTAALTAPQVTATQNFLENANIPAGWVTTALTWVQVLRVVLGIFSFFQRYEAIYFSRTGQLAPSAFAGGVTLATTFGSLPLAVRNALSATATAENIDTAGISGGTTLRVMLKTLGDAYVNRGIAINGIAI